MDLPDGSVALEHETMFSGNTINLLLAATDLHFYQQRRWTVQDDGILCSGMGRDQIRLHRLIIGATPGERVRFRNGDTFDLRRENLVLGGICRNVFGLTALGIYPAYKVKGAEQGYAGCARRQHPSRPRSSARAASLPRVFFREIRRAGGAPAGGGVADFNAPRSRAGPSIRDCLPNLNAPRRPATTCNRPVSKRSANFFRLMSVGGALSK